jgi:hypothetical protein
MTNPAKPGTFEFQFGGNASLRGIAGKGNDLATLFDSRPVSSVLLDRTATVDFPHIICFSSVSVPRFILRRKVREILVLLDLILAPW